MNLYDLENTNKFSKLHTVLNDVFETNFNFNMPKAKLEAVATATDQKIKKLKESGMDVSSKDMQKLLLIAQGLKTVMAEADDVEEEVINETDLDQAEVLLAAKQLGDDLQKMAEDLASMQVEDLMSIHNAMKEEVGTAEADAFNASAEAAISAALEAVKSANEQVTNALLTAQGQAPAAPTDMDMPAEPAGDMGMDPEAPAEDPMGDEMPDMDDLEGADAGAEGREMKESAETAYLNALKTIKEAQVEGKVNKNVLKKAFESLKKFKVSEKAQQGAHMGGGSQHAFDNKKPKQGAPKPKAPAPKSSGPKKGATMGGGTTSAAFK
tara:strand:+ start:418 stop:1389 length:972 start_codon:yes stop_codon:yes gene_type:complete